VDRRCRADFYPLRSAVEVIDEGFLRAAVDAMEESRDHLCMYGELHRLYCALMIPDTRRRWPSALIRLIERVVEDLWNVLTIIHRMDWQREAARNNLLNETDWLFFTMADVRAFDVELRSTYNHAAPMIACLAAKPGQVPRDSFRELRTSQEGMATLTV
jgi:hypothetical protein